MLTRKQADLLNYLRFQIARDGVSPSFEEMKNTLGLASKSGVHRLLSALEERGFIARRRNRARAIEVLKETSVPATPVKLATTEALIAELAARGVHVMEAC